MTQPHLEAACTNAEQSVPQGHDPRADSELPLSAPAPLPYLSRTALRKVKDRLPPPTQCPYCQGSVRLVTNDEIYRGRTYGNWPYAYLCDACGATVGVHPGTDLPLGTLADKALRAARNDAKAQFKQLMRLRALPRDDAYKWLANELGMTKQVCHFAWFDLDQCEAARAACEAGARAATAMGAALLKAKAAQPKGGGTP